MNKNEIKAFFMDHRSAVISIVVVVVLLVGGIFIADGVNANTLRQRQSVIGGWQLEINSLMTKRYELASKMVVPMQALGIPTNELESALHAFGNVGDSVIALSDAYNQLDSSLVSIQKYMLTHPALQDGPDGILVIKLLNACAMAEDDLGEPLEGYEFNVAKLENQIKSFPMNFTASRHDIQAPPRYTVQKALQTRP